MLSLVEKLEDLQAGLDNETYIDVIRQSLLPSYDPFFVNYNMNGLEKSINELINMLVQYEATTKKSEPSVLVGEALISKAKGKGARRLKRKKGMAKAAESALSAPIAPVGMGKGKGKVGSKPIKENNICIHCREKDHWKRECPKLPSSAGTFFIKVLERSRKLSRDEVVLKLSDGKAVAAEAVGHDLIMTAQNKCKMDNQENAQIWYAKLGHISPDRIKRLEVENKTGGKIKTLRSDRGGKYLSGEFLDYLKENEILSQWTPPGMPQLNKRRNRILLDMVRSMMSFTELPLSFSGYALEMAAKLLNMAPSKTVAQTPYQIWHVFLKKGFSADTRHEELLLEESSEATPQTDTVTSSAPIVPTNDIPILRRSTRVSQQPERYGFLGLTGQLDNDPKTYEEAMSDIDWKSGLRP
ncbi:UNVERIFIED_CONTAM: hypothetical protein Sradi_2371800 [Sesamum radiatum]|uniref:Integrase catalytic domain-containing protein n=1 Tax=Sesamum radiatum TaxID=300843 RepID=A0AAW2T612_SESRA